MYCESVHVRIRSFDREEHSALLTLRIAPTNPGNRTTNWLPPPNPYSSHYPAPQPYHGTGLKIELFSESDMFFYFSALLSDSDYQQMKQEQKLLVEFSQFPAMIRELLSNRQMVPALQIDPSGDSVLSIVESNQFRELTHISLKLKRGNDDSVKSYLADRLGQFRNRMESLEDQNNALREELRRAQIERDSFLREMDSNLHSVRSQYQSEIALLKEDHTRELRKIHSSVSNECDTECRKFSDSLRAVEDKLRETERRFDETRLCLVSSESECAAARRRIQALEHEMDTSKEILNKSINESRDYLNKNFELEKKIAEIGIETVTLREKLKRASDRDDDTNQIRQLQAALCDRDTSLEKLKSKVKEQKQLLVKTQEALIKQEQVVLDLQSRLEKFTAISTENETVKSQLIEANKLLESNAQVIAYLNKKLNDRTDYTMFGGIGSVATAPTPSPISTPVIPEYPTRSSSMVEPATAQPTMQRKPPVAVKFTPRCNGQSPPLIKP